MTNLNVESAVNYFLTFFETLLSGMREPDLVSITLSDVYVMPLCEHG